MAGEHIHRWRSRRLCAGWEHAGVVRSGALVALDYCRDDKDELVSTPPRADGLRVLVVDDEPSIVDAVSTALRYEGYDVIEARTGRAGLTAAQTEQPDLIVLDVMLPDIDGFEIARRVRADGLVTPILFLTARDGLDDKVSGFSSGADDYVTKPFSLAEIVLRVRAILQRTAKQTDDNRLTFADVVLDPDTHEVSRAGTAVELTATEFNLLRFFMQNPRRVLSKPQILDHVWHYDFDGDSNILETYISYLRKKLNRLGPPLIHTVRLVGYVLRDTDADS
jgi:two-component system OmpR family response regulator